MKTKKKKKWDKPKLKKIEIDRDHYIYGQCEKTSSIGGCPGALYYT